MTLGNNILKGLIILGLPVIFSACNSGASNNTNEQAVLPLPVVEVEERDVISYNEFPARIEGTVSSEIRPKVSGYILEVAVREGEKVKAGQLLFRLETQSLSQDAAAAKANVDAARVEVEKLEPLVEKNIISSVNLETAKARLAQAQSAYNSVAANIDYARIKSPVDGVVGSINYREGALVSAQDPNPLTNVSNIGEVFANFSMNEKDYIKFSRNAAEGGQQQQIENLPKIKLLLADGSELQEEGSIETISGEINQQTGSVNFRAKFNNSTGILRNGSSVTILVPESFDNAIVIPTLSTFERQQKTFVYRVAPNDSIYSVAIEIATQVENMTVVSNGLKLGDQIVAKGVGKAQPGMKIKPQLISLDSITNSFEPVFN